MDQITRHAAPLGLPEIRQWAELFVASGIFKDARDVAKACVKIQAGQELGLPPFASMRGFDIVEGRPAPNAGLTAALIGRSGRYAYTVLESTADVCRLGWTRDGERIGESSFSIEEARQAGLAGKGAWKSYPADLLFARALTRGARRYCADLFLGSIYTPEELGAADDMGAPIAEDADNAAADAGAVASWRARVESAKGGKELIGIFRAAANEPNVYRSGAAMALAAGRFVDTIPDTLPAGAVDSVAGVLREMLVGLEGAAVSRHAAPERTAVIGSIINALANLGVMGAGAGDAARALPFAEDMDGDELPMLADALTEAVDGLGAGFGGSANPQSIGPVITPEELAAAEGGGLMAEIYGDHKADAESADGAL